MCVHVLYSSCPHFLSVCYAHKHLHKCSLNTNVSACEHKCVYPCGHTHTHGLHPFQHTQAFPIPSKSKNTKRAQACHPFYLEVREWVRYDEEPSALFLVAVPHGDALEAVSSLHHHRGLLHRQAAVHVLVALVVERAVQNPLETEVPVCLLSGQSRRQRQWINTQGIGPCVNGGVMGEEPSPFMVHTKARDGGSRPSSCAVIGQLKLRCELRLVSSV